MGKILIVVDLQSETDICVIINLLAAMTFLPFSQISVDADCCAAQTREGHLSALKIMRACNIAVI